MTVTPSWVTVTQLGVTVTPLAVHRKVQGLTFRVLVSKVSSVFRHFLMTILDVSYRVVLNFLIYILNAISVVLTICMCFLCFVQGL